MFFRLLVVLVAYGLTLLVGVVGAPTRAVTQNLVFDQYQRWKPRPYAIDQPVRIVAVDEESLKRLGQWPWPRERLAALVDALKRAGVASISFDSLFSEKDRGDVTAPADNTPDAAFARSMDDGAVVLGSFVSELPNGATSSKAGFVTAGDDATKFLTPYPGLLSPVPELAQHAAGIGFLNWRPDNDRVVRRVPLILNVNGALQPSLAMEALRTAQGASTYIVKSSNASGEGQVYSVLALRNGDLTIPTDAVGDIRVYFARADPRRSIPAWKALEPGADLSDLRGAIVFFGASAALLSDIVATPLSAAMPGVEVHAQIVEQLLSGQTIRRPDWAPSAEWLATALICAMVILTTWLFAPRIAAAVSAILVCGIVAASWFAFSRQGLLIDPSYPTLSVAAVFFISASVAYRWSRSVSSAGGQIPHHKGRGVGLAVWGLVGLIPIAALWRLIRNYFPPPRILAAAVVPIIAAFATLIWLMVGEAWTHLPVKAGGTRDVATSLEWSSDGSTLLAGTTNGATLRLSAKGFGLSNLGINEAGLSGSIVDASAAAVTVHATRPIGGGKNCRDLAAFIAAPQEGKVQSFVIRALSGTGGLSSELPAPSPLCGQYQSRLSHFAVDDLGEVFYALPSVNETPGALAATNLSDGTTAYFRGESSPVTAIASLRDGAAVGRESGLLELLGTHIPRIPFKDAQTSTSAQRF
jgi:CHASE2 domain-containing sensor protein